VFQCALCLLSRKTLIGALTCKNRLPEGRTCDGVAAYGLDSAPVPSIRGPLRIIRCADRLLDPITTIVT
jgi:hypothetical protein